MRTNSSSTRGTAAPSGKRERAGRRSPVAAVSLILVGLMTTGGAYALFSSGAFSSPAAADSATVVTQSTVDEGQKLFAANCATCHGINAEGAESGPSLYGVGAASVDFQVGTGRMPLAATGPQAEKKPVQFTEVQIAAMAAYVASLAPGPAIPDEEYLQGDGDATLGAELFRINCAMCHNVAGAGGALTEGKYAPALGDVEPKHVYEAMVTGPQNMPVFNDLNLSPQEKADVITYLTYLENTPSPGGLELGNLGPVAEGLFMWIFGLGAIVGVTIWIAAKAS